MARRLMWCVSVCLLLTACASPARRELSQAVTIRQQARQAYARGDLVRARAEYVRLTRLVPNDMSAWFHLGNVYARSDQPQLAVDAYRRVLGRDAAYAKAWHNLGVVLMQQAQAAFAQSAQVAGSDAELRSQDIDMERRLNTLVQPKASHETQTSRLGADEPGGSSR